MNKLEKLIQSFLPHAIVLRRQLHQIPELKFQEFKTSTLIKAKLQEFGFSDIQACAQTGVIALLDSGKPGKTIALRADINALPFVEKNQLHYRSQHDNAMHACGHDGHTATLLAAAWILLQLKNELHGKIKFIFQPAEEGGKGSSAMIAEGVLANPAVNAIYGYHNWPGLPLGSIAIKPGAILAGNGRFEIVIQGRVAHTAMPQLAINPVTIGAQIIIQLELLRKKLFGTDTSIINIINFNCGELKGGMTEQATILGVYYIDDFEKLTQLKLACETIVNKIVETERAEIKIHFTEYHSPTINTEHETDFILQAARANFSHDKIFQLTTCQFAADDFSEYLKYVPGCYFLIGSGKNSPSVHTDQFDFPDEILMVAIKMMCLAALQMKIF